MKTRAPASRAEAYSFRVTQYPPPRETTFDPDPLIPSFIRKTPTGQGIWEVNVPGTKGVKVNQFMILALIPFAIFMVFSNIRKVYTTNRDEMPIEERGHKAVRFFFPLLFCFRGAASARFRGAMCRWTSGRR